MDVWSLEEGHSLIESIICLAMLSIFLGLSFLVCSDMPDRYRIDCAAKELVGDLRLVQAKSMNQGEMAIFVLFYPSSGEGSGYHVKSEGVTILKKDMPENIVINCYERDALRFDTHGFPQTGRRIILHCGKYTRLIIIDFVGRIRIEEGE